MGVAGDRSQGLAMIEMSSGEDKGTPVIQLNTKSSGLSKIVKVSGIIGNRQYWTLMYSW